MAVGFAIVNTVFPNIYTDNIQFSSDSKPEDSETIEGNLELTSDEIRKAFMDSNYI